MRVHDARFNSDYQLYAVRPAAEAEALNEAEQARKQRRESCWTPDGSEDEDCVVTLQEREGEPGDAPQEDQSDRGDDGERSPTGSDDLPWSEYA